MNAKCKGPVYSLIGMQGRGDVPPGVVSKTRVSERPLPVQDTHDLPLVHKLQRVDYVHVVAHLNGEASAIQQLESRFQAFGIFGASGMDLHATRCNPALDVEGCSRVCRHPAAPKGKRTQGLDCRYLRELEVRLSVSGTRFGFQRRGGVTGVRKGDSVRQGRGPV